MYEFGDIVDARSAPPPLGHFIIVVGETKNEIMYFLVTSRTYRVFPEVVNFFNDCIDTSYKRFFSFFGKEREKLKTGRSITIKGRLTDALFLDHKTHYAGHLNEDSMIMIGNPRKMDQSVMKRLKREDKIGSGGRLSNIDICKLITMLKQSQSISPSDDRFIRQSFNSLISSRKGGGGAIKCD